MEKPYRYLKKLVKFSSSFYVIIPATWLNANKAAFRKMKTHEVILEVYDDKIVITPKK